MRRAIFTAALFAVAIAPATPGAADQISINGTARSYVINQPAAAKGPQPTIIVLHDTKGTGAAIAQSTKLGTLAPQQGYVAVFPDGLRQQWDFYLPGKELDYFVKASKSAGGVPDDAGFLKGLIADLVKRGIADPKRIYLAGEANGSLMAMRMLCTDSNLFAGAALLGAAMPETLGAECHPPQPVPILVIKGTKDAVFPYAGGLVEPDETFRVWTNDRLVGFLQQVDADTGAPQSLVLPRKVPNVVAIDQWATCPGIPLSVYRVIDGPHIAPADLNEGQVVLDFFASPTLSSPCVASLQNPGSGTGTSPGANAGSGPGPNSVTGPNSATNPNSPTNPNGQGATPGTGPNGAPGNATGPNGTDPNAPGGPGGNSPGGDTAGLAPPPDPGNPGGDTAGLAPPPDNNPGNSPPNNPTSPMPGSTVTMIPPTVYPPPIFIPIPGGGTASTTPACNPNICKQCAPPSKPVPTPPTTASCNPNTCSSCAKQPNSGAPVLKPNPNSTQVANAPPNSGPLVLKPNLGTQATPVPPPSATGVINLKPALFPPTLPTTTASTGSCMNQCGNCAPKPPTTSAATHAPPPPPPKKVVQKKQTPVRSGNSEAQNAANAAAAAAAASAIIGIVGAFGHHGGGGGGNRC